MFILKILRKLVEWAPKYAFGGTDRREARIFPAMRKEQDRKLKKI